MKNDPLFAPIDWKAWEAEAAAYAANRGKGRKQTEAQRERNRQAQLKRHARAREALAALAREQAREAELARANAPKPLYEHERMFAALEPGKWYASRDMANLAGVKYQTCKAWVVKWYREGWLARAQNPAWETGDVCRGGMATRQVRWLYRLTAKGVQRHRFAVALH